jgi:hypothetical protein
MSSNDNKENLTDNITLELMIFKGEKNKRHKKGILWQKHKELVADDKILYTKKEKSLIKDLLYNPIPSEMRPKYWVIISGARQEMINNPGYYDKLKTLAKMAPNNPFIKPISLDLRRTFPAEAFFKDETNLEKLNNILLAFSFRNSISIGYCQGFNFIVGRILMVTGKEEDTFWIFTKIVEDFLPFDFYLKFTGVRIDTSIVSSLLSKTLDYYNKSEELKICLSNLVTRCFISLYCEIVGMDVSNNIIDIFFIYGERILYRSFTYIAYFLCNKEFRNYDIERIHEVLLNKLEKLDDTDLLNYFLLTNHKINDSYIKENRKKKKDKIYEQNMSFRESIAGNESVNCDLRTPYCVYNEDINNIEKYNEFKIFKLKKNTQYFENYFEEKLKEKNKNDIIIINENNSSSKKETKVTLEDLDNVLVERHPHVCNKKK